MIVVRSDEPGVDGYDVVLDSADGGSLTAALRTAGAIDVSPEAAEVVRIEAGRPRFGDDMDAETIPLEAGIEDRAISRTKGCYVGQEVIVRVLDRGQGRVARHLVGLRLASDVPRGSAIAVGGRDIGRITSVVHSAALGEWIALGYVSARPHVSRDDRDGGGCTGVSQRPAVRRLRRGPKVEGRGPNVRYRAACNNAIKASSAGGKASAFSSLRVTHRISCPSSGVGGAVRRHAMKCSSTVRSG